MSGPQRIQRRRTKGWRMPEDAIYVGRPTEWGNPFPVGGESPFAPEEAVRMYRELIEDRETWWEDLGRHRFTQWHGDLPVPTVDDVRAVLAGRDLACWCHLDQPCHADVLLEIANGGPR